MLSIRVNGENLENFQRAKVIRSIETLCGAFSFTSTANNNNLFPVRSGDFVECLADGIIILTGYVDDSPVEYDTQSHSISVVGRSILQDVVDSSVPTTKEFTGSISLISIIRTVLNDLGLTKIKIINNAGTIDNFAETEITSAEIGQTAFEFIELFARKRQVLLTDNGPGNLVIARASTKRATIRFQHKSGRDDNNILSASYSNDLSNRYRTYRVNSALNPFFQNDAIDAATIVNQKGTVTDSKIRSTRFLEMNAEESSDNFTALDRSKWEANYRRSVNFNYRCTVNGHTIIDKNKNIIPYEPNTLYHVKDDFADIDADLLAKAIEYNYSIESGSTSDIIMAQKDAFTLQAEQNQREASREQTGDGFLV